MSTVKERDALGDILMREFGEYATALTDAGHDWAQVWPIRAWPPESRLRELHNRFLLAREMATAGGARLSDAEITRQYRDRLSLLESFPDGRVHLEGP
ncbi:hypothetical protein [Streptomyces sp. NPDC097619]|uniref:hypothetical protein n=1 Tax=Streptomyces sp. NPDC097619 TaxID=3157228 RepID=UPI00332E0F93